MRHLALTVLLLITTLGSGPALAAPESGPKLPVSLAIIPMEADAAFTGPADELLSAIRKAVGGESDLIEKGPVAMTLADARLSFGCFDEVPSCMSQVGSSFKADWLMWGKLSQEGDEWWLELALIEVNGNRVLQQSRLTARGEGALSLLAEQVLDILIRQLRPSELKVTFLSEPSGARVLVDGRPRGRTPVGMRLPVGEHSLTLELDQRRVVRRFKLRQGQGARTIEATLPPAAEVGVVKPERPGDPAKGDRAGLWLGVGSGVIALGAATASVILGLDVLDLQAEAEDRKAAREPFSDLEAEFNRKRTFTNVGWAVSAVAAGSAVYFLFFHDEPEPASPSVGVSPSPGGVWLHGTF